MMLSRHEIDLMARTERVRNETIEECARVAETWYENHHPVYCDEIAAAIRALKEKP